MVAAKLGFRPVAVLGSTKNTGKGEVVSQRVRQGGNPPRQA